MMISAPLLLLLLLRPAATRAWALLPAAGPLRRPRPPAPGRAPSPIGSKDPTTSAGGGDPVGPPPPASADGGAVLVLGGSGLVGSRVVEILGERDVPSVSTTTDGRDGSVALDLTDPDAPAALRDLCESRGVSAVVSAAGCVLTGRDYEVNSAPGRALRGAFGSEEDRGGGDGPPPRLPRLVLLGGPPRCAALPFLREYARGKAESERLAAEAFGGRCAVVRPTLIHGGDSPGLRPPRMPSSVGGIVEAVLGLYPFRALAGSLPDALGVWLDAPVSVDAVAGAAVNLATGAASAGGGTALDTRDGILMAASRRPGAPRRGALSPEDGRRRDELKRVLSRSAADRTPEENFAMLEELEELRPPSARPVDDARLNGRWDFCFDVEPDVGTGFIKVLFEGDGPEWMRNVIDFRGVRMEIGEGQSAIRLRVSLALLRNEVDVVLHTSLRPAPPGRYSDDGTMFLERFEGVEVGGIRLPYPDAWRGDRFLEFTYLDEGFAVARGAGGLPHFLVRSPDQ